MEELNPHLEELIEIYRNDFKSEEGLLEFITKWIENDSIPNIGDYLNN